MERIKKILQWLLPLFLGLFLFWLVFRKMDFASMKEIISQGLRWEWIAVYVLLFLLPMILRGLRWQQLLDEASPGARVGHTILSVFVAYGANLIFPRIGEVARCGLLKKHDGISFTKSLGSVVTERVFDIICLLLMALAAVLLQMDVFRQFFVENPDSAQKISALLLSWKLWLAVIVFVILSVLAFRFLKTKTIYQKVKNTLKHSRPETSRLVHFLHDCHLGLVFSVFLRRKIFLQCAARTGTVGHVYGAYHGKLRYRGSGAGRYRRLAFHGYFHHGFLWYLAVLCRNFRPDGARIEYLAHHRLRTLGLPLDQFG